MWGTNLWGGVPIHSDASLNQAKRHNQVLENLEKIADDQKKRHEEQLEKLDRTFNATQEIKHDIKQMKRELKYEIRQVIDDKLQIKDITFNSQPPTPHFTSRIAELNAIKENFCKTNFVAIKGRCGIGKTELARQYAQNNLKFYDGNVIWINSQNMHTLQMSFKHLALQLGIKMENKIMDLLCNINQRLHNMKCLLVYDNVGEYFHIKEYMYNAKSHVLITQWRDTSHDEYYKIEEISLETFSGEEAHSFFEKSLGSPVNKEDAEELSDKMEGLPLALQLVVAYIREERKTNKAYGITSYLCDCKASLEDLSNLLNGEELLGILKSWYMTFKKLNSIKSKASKQALEIVNCIAYFGCDDFKIKKYFSFPPEEALKYLTGYGILSGVGSCVSINPLLSKAIRRILRGFGKHEGVMRKCLQMVSSRNEENDINHVIYLLKHTSYRLPNFSPVERGCELLKFNRSDRSQTEAIIHSLQRNIRPEYICQMFEYFFKTPEHGVIIKSFLAYKVDVNYKIGSQTILMYALENAPSDPRYLPIVDDILSKSANVKTQDSKGNTALHYAVKCGRENIIKLLYKNGADDTIRNNDGLTPLEKAIKEQARESIIKVLQEMSSIVSDSA